VSLYAQYKLEAEVALHSLATESFCVTSLRSATVYGVAPRMRFDLVVNIMTLHAWKRGRLFVLGGGRQWRPLVHVSDVAQAFVLALQAPANLLNRTILNVGDNAQNFQVRDIAEIVRCVVPNTRVEQVSEDDDNRSYRVAFDKAEQLLGFKTKHHVEDGVKEILEGLEKGELRDDISTQTLAFYRNLFDDRRVMGK
jgi:nucleoside-diphosphate-sugar epimerase